MQKQMTFSDVEYGARKRVSRREIFLDMMEGIVPWQILTALIEPWYFSGARGGGQPASRHRSHVEDVFPVNLV
jgi:IS5 family transposase